ncbi:MAG: hypothetical protein IPK71_22470 [Myxococcales bacterium]|nr:hypothetical protein [Myxococcales bacterium]
MSPLSELAPGRGLPRVAAPNVEGASIVVCGEVRVAELGEGVELVRFGSADHARAERIYSLSVAGLFGIRAAGVDAEGPWLVREPGAPTLEDRPEVDPLELATSLARALAACERSALFPGPLRPRDVSRFEGRISLRADALYRALAGMPADPSAREGASRWDSPEVASGRAPDAASNRYALGLLVYRAATGAHPFAGVGRLEAQNLAAHDPAPFPSEVASRLPPGLQSLVLELLDPRPDARPRSAADVARRLEAIATGRRARGDRAPSEGRKAPPAAVSTPSRPARHLPVKRRIWVLAPVGVALAALVTGLLARSSALRVDPVPVAMAQGAPLTRARAADCAPCHAREVSEWQRSVMAHASRSPLFGALESVVEEQNGRDARCPNGPGALRSRGADVCTDERSGLSVTGSGGEGWCIRCHAPTESVRPSVPPWSAFGNASSRRPLIDMFSAEALEGISCQACHATVGPVGTHGSGGYEGNPSWTSARTGNVFFARPEDADGRFGIANSGYRIELSSFLDGRGQGARPHGAPSASAKAYGRSSELCGSCHDVRLFGTDVIGKERGEHFKRLRNGYSEWRAWASTEEAAGRRAATCQDCHMSTFPAVCEPGAPTRPAERSDACPPGHRLVQRAPGEYASGFVSGGSARKDKIFSHYFTSVDVPLTPSFDLSFANDRALDARGVPLGLRPRRDLLLARSFRFAIEGPRRTGRTLEVPVVLENVGAGHRVPAGFSQEREVWVELRVLDARGDVVYEVGRVDGPGDDLHDKRFLRVNVRDVVGQGRGQGRTFGRDEDPDGRPLGVFGADVVDGPDVPDWSPSPRLGGTSFRGRGLVNLQNGFLRCVRCIGFVDGKGRCQPGPGQGRTRADRYEDAPYDPETGECRSNLSGGEELFETYFPIGALDADRGTAKAPDAIVDTRSAPPGVPLTYTYVLDTGAHQGPYRVEAKLRFRSFPPFLVRAFAAYEAEQAARGARPSGPQVDVAMLSRIDVVDIGKASAKIE